MWRYILYSVFFISVFLKSLPASLVLKKLSSSPNCHLHGALDFILSDTNKTPGNKLIFLYFMQSRLWTWPNNLFWQEYFIWWWKWLRLLAYTISVIIYINLCSFYFEVNTVYLMHISIFSIPYMYIYASLCHIFVKVEGFTYWHLCQLFTETALQRPEKLVTGQSWC